MVEKLLLFLGSYPGVTFTRLSEAIRIWYHVALSNLFSIYLLMLIS